MAAIRQSDLADGGTSASVAELTSKQHFISVKQVELIEMFEVVLTVINNYGRNVSITTSIGSYVYIPLYRSPPERSRHTPDVTC